MKKLILLLTLINFVRVGTKAQTITFNNHSNACNNIYIVQISYQLQDANLNFIQQCSFTAANGNYLTIPPHGSVTIDASTNPVWDNGCTLQPASSQYPYGTFGDATFTVLDPNSCTFTAPNVGASCPGPDDGFRMTAGLGGCITVNQGYTCNTCSSSTVNWSWNNSVSAAVIDFY